MAHRKIRWISLTVTVTVTDLTVNKSDKKQENAKQMSHCGWTYMRCIPDILLPFSLYLVMFFHTWIEVCKYDKGRPTCLLFLLCISALREVLPLLRNKQKGALF